ncbi:MAG: hypothetical protein ACRDZ2_12765 [Ilumatobacteraceae bacterium]
MKQYARPFMSRRDEALLARIDALSARMDIRIDALSDKMDTRFDALAHKMDTRFDAVTLRMDTLVESIADLRIDLYTHRHDD